MNEEAVLVGRSKSLCFGFIGKNLLVSFCVKPYDFVSAENLLVWSRMFSEGMRDKMYGRDKTKALSIFLSDKHQIESSGDMYSLSKKRRECSRIGNNIKYRFSANDTVELWVHKCRLQMCKYCLICRVSGGLDIDWCDVVCFVYVWNSLLNVCVELTINMYVLNWMCVLVKTRGNRERLQFWGSYLTTLACQL